MDADFDYVNDPFSFKLTNNNDKNQVLVDTTNGTFIFEDKFIQIDMKLPS